MPRSCREEMVTPFIMAGNTRLPLRVGSTNRLVDPQFFE